MFYDILEEFRKEYYKEIWSISSVSSPGKNISSRFIPTSSEIPTEIYNKKCETWERVGFQKNTLLPIIEKYLEQICERYEDSENDYDLMRILPELGVVPSGDTLLKFIKSLYVMYSIISTDQVHWVENYASKSFKFKTISEGLRKIKSVPDRFPFLYSRKMNDTYRDITKRRLLRQELCRIKRTFFKEIIEEIEKDEKISLDIYRTTITNNEKTFKDKKEYEKVEVCEYVGYTGHRGGIIIILDPQGEDYKSYDYSHYLDNLDLNNYWNKGFILE